MHTNKTGENVYLHIRRWVKPVEPPKEDGEPPQEKKPTRLALGVEGGFSGGVEPVKYEEEHQLVVGSTTIPLPCAALPQKIEDCIAGILSAESAYKQDQIAAWEEPLIVTKHAETLVQLDNGVKIPKSGWKCSKCDLTNNLWLNLTDGSILCGRKYFDGSGGNNHAVDHYKATRFPLAVKLGTITPGGADVYSYDEDSMVVDPLLSVHLSHFGINMMIMDKTDKTMTELQIDANIRFGEWSLIQETGKQLKLLYGPGYTGLRNLGNSCYINSSLQVLFSLPEFKARYFDTAVAAFQNARDPVKDFNMQMCKIARGLLSGKYSEAPPTAPPTTIEPQGDETLQKEQDGIRLDVFKTLIGTGHREFSSNRQQDAQEFLLHLLTTMDRAEHASRGNNNMVNLFRYQVEERIQCTVSGMVRYNVKPEVLLTLPVPMATATNQEEVAVWKEKESQLKAEKKPINPEDVVRAKVSYTSCLTGYSSPTNIDDFYSTALKTKSTATR
jgi:ubiquitin carboxyl-terminal hydrolase 5/13